MALRFLIKSGLTSPDTYHRVFITPLRTYIYVCLFVFFFLCVCVCVCVCMFVCVCVCVYVLWHAVLFFDKQNKFGSKEEYSKRFSKVGGGVRGLKRRGGQRGRGCELLLLEG